MVLLLEHDFTRELRELEAVLWRSAAESGPGRLDVTPGVRALLGPVERDVAEPTPSAPEPDAAAINAALAAAGGSVTRAARQLGLANRFVLYRLMKKHGLGE